MKAPLAELETPSGFRHFDCKGITMSNITIYQPTLDQALDLLIERTQTIMIRGRDAAVEMCMAMAETQEYITQTYRKKHRHAIQKEVYEKLGVQRSTFTKYARAGAIYLAEPEKRQLSMDAVLEVPKKERPVRAMTIAATKPAIDEDRLAELLKWEAFAMYLSEQMPERHFDAVYNKFLKQYELH